MEPRDRDRRSPGRGTGTGRHPGDDELAGYVDSEDRPSGVEAALRRRPIETAVQRLHEACPGIDPVLRIPDRIEAVQDVLLSLAVHAEDGPPSHESSVVRRPTEPTVRQRDERTRRARAVVGVLASKRIERRQGIGRLEPKDCPLTELASLRRRPIQRPVDTLYEPHLPFGGFPVEAGETMEVLKGAVQTDPKDRSLTGAAQPRRSVQEPVRHLDHAGVWIGTRRPRVGDGDATAQIEAND